MKCTCLACPNEAKWVPTLLIYMPAEFQINTAIKAELSAYKCDRCKDHTELAAILSDDMWERFSTEIEQSKGVAPDRKRSQLAWTPVTQSALIAHLEADAKRQII